MITFWVFAVAMLVIALIFLLRPLLIEMNKTDVDRAAQNVAITKERLNELKVEFEQDTITQKEYDESKKELEQSLLNDVEESSERKQTVNNRLYSRFTRVILILVVPILAVSVYAYLGQPDLIDVSKKQASTAAGHTSGNGANKMQQFEEVVTRLAERMKNKPDNAEGWFMLGRSYMSLKRYEEAVDALEKAYQLVPENPNVLLMYADALTMLRNGEISGKPFELIKKATAIKPNDPTGLWLLGMGYEEQGEYKKAISAWNSLLPLLKNEKPINEVQQLIKQAKIKSGVEVTEISESKTRKSEKKSTTSIKVNVSIDQSKLKAVSMTDTIFIFAKAVNGPPMPLAVVRKQVKDLPLQIILDDSLAMVPSMALSSFDKVKITARVSKTGNPLLQKGDIYSKEKQISLPFNGVINIKIDSVVR